MTVHTDDPCRRLLEAVPHQRLDEWCRELGIFVPRRGGTSAIIDALIESTKFSFSVPGILKRMSPPELGLVCRELGGMGSSLDREKLEERIIAILTPDPSEEAVPRGPSRLPVDAWLDGRRNEASRASERQHQNVHKRNSTWIRAAVWALLFAALSRFGVFRQTSDALILGFGVTLVAATIYRHALTVPVSMALAATEIGVRLTLIGYGFANSFTLSLICVAELLCAGAISVDAESARNAEVTLGFREHMQKSPPALEEPDDPVELDPEEPAPSTRR